MTSGTRSRTTSGRQGSRYRAGAAGHAVSDVVRHLRDVAGLPEIAGKCTPAVDLLRAARPGCRIVPVTITGGDQEGSDGTVYRVPKRDLIIGLQVVVEQRRLEIAKRSRSHRELMAELAEIKSTVTGFGRTTFEADGSRAHDDLVLALALAWWRVRKTGPRRCLEESCRVLLAR